MLCKHLWWNWPPTWSSALPLSAHVHLKKCLTSRKITQCWPILALRRHLLCHFCKLCSTQSHKYSMKKHNLPCLKRTQYQWARFRPNEEGRAFKCVMNYLATRCSVFIKSQRFSFHKAAFHCVLPLVFIFQKQIQTAIGQNAWSSSWRHGLWSSAFPFWFANKGLHQSWLKQPDSRPLRHTAPTLSASNWVASMANKGGREAAKR